MNLSHDALSMTSQQSKRPVRGQHEHYTDQLHLILAVSESKLNLSADPQESLWVPWAFLAQDACSSHPLTVADDNPPAVMGQPRSSTLKPLLTALISQ